MASGIIDTNKTGGQLMSNDDAGREDKREQKDSTVELKNIIRSKQQTLYNAHASFFNELVDVLVER